MYILYDSSDFIPLSIGTKDEIKARTNEFIFSLKSKETRQLIREVSTEFPDVEGVADELICNLSVIEVKSKLHLNSIINNTGYLKIYIKENSPLNLVDSLLNRENLEIISLDKIIK